MLGADIALHEVSFFSAFFPNGLSNHALENFSCTCFVHRCFVEMKVLVLSQLLNEIGNGIALMSSGTGVHLDTHSKPIENLLPQHVEDSLRFVSL